MNSYLLENSNFENDIQYEWNINSLHVLATPLNNLSNIIRKVKWSLWVKLEVTGQIYSEFMFGECIFPISDLDSENFIPYENLSLHTVVNWIKETLPNIENELKEKLLNQQIYITSEMQLPWESSEVIESNIEIISKNFSEETPVEPASEETPPEEVPETP